MTVERVHEVNWLRSWVPSAMYAYLLLEPWQIHCISCGDAILPRDWSWENIKQEQAIHDACSLPREGEEK